MAAITARDERLRALLEVATAVLLGLVSVATAAGAYQASAWAQKAGEYESAAGMLRDESLSTYIASEVALYDDTERLGDAIDLQFQIANAAPDEVADLQAQLDVLLDGASPGLHEAYDAWAAGGFGGDIPGADPAYIATNSAQSYSANLVSAVAYDLSDQLGDRSLQITVASAIFALALLLLGVSGANANLKVAFGLAVGGAGVFVVGVVVSLLAIIG